MPLELREVIAIQDGLLQVVRSLTRAVEDRRLTFIGHRELYRSLEGLAERARQLDHQPEVPRKPRPESKT